MIAHLFWMMIEVLFIIHNASELLGADEVNPFNVVMLGFWSMMFGARIIVALDDLA